MFTKEELSKPEFWASIKDKPMAYKLEAMAMSSRYHIDSGGIVGQWAQENVETLEFVVWARSIGCYRVFCGTGTGRCYCSVCRISPVEFDGKRVFDHLNSLTTGAEFYDVYWGYVEKAQRDGECKQLMGYLLRDEAFNNLLLQWHETGKFAAWALAHAEQFKSSLKESSKIS